MTCSHCGREMRDYKVTAEEAPGTVSRGNTDTCQSCANRRRGRFTGPSAEAPAVLVKVMLPLDAFRELRTHADAMGVEVGVLISKLTERSLEKSHPAPEVPPEAIPDGRLRRRMTEEQIKQAVELRALNKSWREIGLAVGVADATARQNVIRWQAAQDAA